MRNLLTSAESWVDSQKPVLHVSGEAIESSFIQKDVHFRVSEAVILVFGPYKLHYLPRNNTTLPYKEDAQWLQFSDAGIILLLASFSNGNTVDLLKTQST